MGTISTFCSIETIKSATMLHTINLFDETIVVLAAFQPLTEPLATRNGPLLKHCSLIDILLIQSHTQFMSRTLID
jgi:hypothetical protein